MINSATTFVGGFGVVMTLIAFVGRHDLHRFGRHRIAAGLTIRAAMALTREPLHVQWRRRKRRRSPLLTPHFEARP